MNKHSVILVLGIMLLSITACTGKGGEFDLSKPVSLDLEPPEGPPEYRQGWSDGCESGMSTWEGHFYKIVANHKLRIDPVLWNNKVYSQIWYDAFAYCRIFTEARWKYAP